MSGGAFDYFYYKLEEHVGDFGDVELDNLMSDLAQLHHDREWYMSGDTSEGEWNIARDEFKAKWFTSDGKIKRAEQYINDVVDKLKTDLGIKTEHCGDCIHWTPTNDASDYGQCKYHKGHLDHKGTSACKKYEQYYVTT